jgi:hypothetical protein
LTRIKQWIRTAAPTAADIALAIMSPIDAAPVSRLTASPLPALTSVDVAGGLRAIAPNGEQVR